MQLHALYVSEWHEGKVVTWAYVDTINREIGEIQQSEVADDFEHLQLEYVQLEHNGQHFDFECEDGQFTEIGKKDFINFLEETLLKP